jgi:hypothetical protein
MYQFAFSISHPAVERTVHCCMLRPRETAVITDQGRITVYDIWRRIFNYLLLLQMTLFHTRLLHWLLRFCHRRSSGATKLGLSLMWQATSRVQRGIGTENDEDTPVFTMSYPLLPLVCGTRMSGSSSTRASHLWCCCRVGPA